jgi:membrane protein YqaA with SNARE-associated domain
VLQRLYDWTMEKAAHRHAVWYMCVFAFAESTFFPFPADILMVPMILANRDQAWRLAFFAGTASAIGGVFGYGIGYFLFEEVGKPILELYGYMQEFGKIQDWYKKYGELIVAVGGLTPIPYKAVTITSGVAQMDFVAFTAVSFVTRLVRFFAVAAALYIFGPPIKRFMDNNLKLATLLFLAVFIGGFVAIYYLA